MSLLLAAALAVTPATLPSCSWDRPGANPFTGNVVEAVDRYSDIPQAVRKALKERMVARQYDEIATIGRDAITGAQRYSPEIRDMHFGNGTVCRTVTRKKWPEAAVERGLVYCESGHCLIVPTVCRNVSRVTRLLPERAAAADRTSPKLAGAGTGAGAGSAPGDDTGGRAKALAAPGDGELQFDAPGAGASFAQLAATDAPIVETTSIAPVATSGAAAITGTGPAATGGSTSAVTAGGSADGGGVNAPGASDGLDPGRFGAAPPILGASPFMSSGGGGGGGGPFIAPTTTETSTTPVPEPGTWALMSLGALAVLAAARRRGRAD